MPRSLLKVHWQFNFQHKPFFCQLLLFAVTTEKSMVALALALWMSMCWLNYLHPWNNPSGTTLTAFTAAHFLDSVLQDRISLPNSVWQKVQSAGKRSKHLKNLTATGQAFSHAYKRYGEQWYRTFQWERWMTAQYRTSRSFQPDKLQTLNSFAYLLKRTGWIPITFQIQ